MNNFEEQMTRWADGQMSPDEAAAFETRLSDKDAALHDKEAWQRLREGLKSTSLPSPQYARDASFLSSQIARSIREELPPQSAPVQNTKLRSPWRLAWSGLAFCLAAVVLGAVIIRHNDGITNEQDFISHVIETRSTNPERYGAYSFSTPDGKGAVIWIENPGFIPAQQSIR